MFSQKRDRFHRDVLDSQCSESTLHHNVVSETDHKRLKTTTLSDFQSNPKQTSEHSPDYLIFRTNRDCGSDDEETEHQNDAETNVDNEDKDAEIAKAAEDHADDEDSKDEETFEDDEDDEDSKDEDTQIAKNGKNHEDDETIEDKEDGKTHGEKAPSTGDIWESSLSSASKESGDDSETEQSPQLALVKAVSASEGKYMSWLKTMCLTCQVCQTTFDDAEKALKCFKAHDCFLRCYVCFSTIKGGPSGKGATKLLYKHYKDQHQNIPKKDKLKCEQCGKICNYKAVSTHIIAVHVVKALALSDGSQVDDQENGVNQSKLCKTMRLS